MYVCMYVLCNISQIIFIYFFFRERESERKGRRGGGGGRAKIYLYLNTNFIHQRSRFSAYTMTGRVNKPLDMYSYIFMPVSMMFKFHCTSKLSNEGHDCGSQTSPSKTCMCIKNISQS